MGPPPAKLETRCSLKPPCLLPLLALLSPGPAIPQDAVLLAGFEDPAELTSATASRARFELAGGDRQAGERSLRIDYEAVPSGRRDYPAFVLQGDALRGRDFSRFGALAFWVKNLGATAAELSVAILDDAGRRSFPRPSTLTIEPGVWQRAHCRLVLHGLDPRAIGSVHFFQDSNREPRSFLLDQVELLSPLAGRILARQQEVNANLERARNNASRIGLQEAIAPDLEQLARRLREVMAPDPAAGKALRAEEQMAALSRVARDAADLAGSISIYNDGHGLTLDGPRVTDAWLESAQNLSGILRFAIVNTATTGAGLARIGGRLELNSLTLGGKGLDGAGLAAFSGAKLENLDLEGSGVHDGTLVHLQRFPALRNLNLARTRVTGAGLEHLASLSRLESLSLDGTATTDQGLAHLRGLSSLDALSLDGTPVTGTGLAHLKDLKKLKTLSLKGTPLAPAGLAELRRLASLETLNLAGTGILGLGPAEHGRLEKLVVLDLTGTRVNDAALIELGKLSALSRLEVSSTRITDAGLIHVAAASRLGYLDLYGTNVTDAGLRQLANQHELLELYLGGTAATDDTLAALKEIGGLQRLDLQRTRAGDAGLESLAGLKKLTALNLAGTAVAGSGLVHLQGLGELQDLDLGGTEVGDEALARLAGLRGLRRLGLGGTRVTDAGLEFLLRLEKLRELDLQGTPVTDAGVALLSKLPELRELRLDETAAGDAGLLALREAKNLTLLGLSRTGVTDAGLSHLGDQLRALDLRNTAVSDAGVARLKGRDRLARLDLAGTGITDDAVAALSGLPGLTVVDLGGTRVTDAGLQALGSFPSLEQIDLERTRITDLGVETLARLPGLNRVALEGTRVTVEGLTFLRRKRPALEVKLDRPWIEAAGLSRYELHAGRPGAPGAVAHLAGVRELGSVRSLRLHGPVLDPQAVALLPDLPGLEHLDLRGTDLDDAGLASLIRLQRLASLNLSRSRITDLGLVHLEGLRELTALDLEGTAVRGDGLRHLEALPRLRSLNLRDTPFTDAGAARAAALPALRRLELTNTRLTDRGIASLSGLPDLRYLDLYGTAVTGEGLASLGRMPELTHLYLGATAVTDADLRRLAGLEDLAELGLERTAVTDAGCAALAGFLRLERLKLADTAITDRGLEEITRLPALESLDLRGTRVTAAGAERFRRLRPRAALELADEGPGPSALGLAATVLYCFLALALCVYGAHRYWLTWLFARTRDARVPPPPAGRFLELPRVTVQLPMFNERRVAERAIAAACALDYPRDRLQVQVLDDSSDESAAVARAACERWRRAGFDIEYLHRDGRRGFKGGALEAGLASATGEFVAIFDADFVPSPDFLERTIHHFTDPHTGMVQTEWAHLNRGESLLTECQALYLDGHFIVEQAARFRSGRWFNFNGTAGVWRRRSIEEAGGWHHDTLTEDTDLSYRAQLAGWRFIYLAGVRSGAELPSAMSAFLGQQRRWTKGLVENAVKLLPRILKSPVPAAVKAEAWFHLTSPLMYLVMFLLTALALPAFFIAMPLAEFRALPALAIGMAVLVMGTLAAAAFLITAQRAQGLGLWRTVARLPAVMALGVGMSAANARAAVEGLLGVRGPFVRTPKFNGRTDFDPDPAARGRRGIPAGLVELAAAGVLLGCLVLSLARPFTLIGAPFLLLFAGGYFWVGAASLEDAVTTRTSVTANGRARRPRAARLALTGALVALAGILPAAAFLIGTRARPGAEPVLALGVELPRADWRRRGEAIEGLAAHSGGLEVAVALAPERDQGEVFLDLDGPLAPLGDSLARGRELRFEVLHPERFAGELQAFVVDAGGRSQYGSALFVEPRDARRGGTVAISPGRRTPAMGYSDPGFDPAGGLRRIGLKVSAQSDRVLGRGYRPFRGAITIADLRLLDRPPAPEPDVREPRRDRVLDRCPGPAAAFAARSGVDRPWPFGYGFSGPIAAAHREELERTYAAVKARGLGFTRVYAGDYRTGLALGEEGNVSGIEEPFLDYLEAVVEAAGRHGITVMLSLTDNTIADGKGIEHPEFIAEPAASAAFLANGVVPIAARLARHRVILDLFNEPENVTGLPLAVVQQYVQRAIDLLRAAVPGARLTVVSRSREDLIYWRGRGLDLLAHNLFEARALDAATAGDAAEVDAPLLVAEMDPALATGANLERLRRAGYQGVGLWGWGTDDKYAWRAADLDRIAAPLRDQAAAGGEP